MWDHSVDCSIDCLIGCSFSADDIYEVLFQPYFMRILKRQNVSHGEWQILFQDVYQFVSWTDDGAHSIPLGFMANLRKSATAMVSEVRDAIVGEASDPLCLRKYVKEWQQYFEISQHAHLPFRNVDILLLELPEFAEPKKTDDLEPIRRMLLQVSSSWRTFGGILLVDTFIFIFICWNFYFPLNSAAKTEDFGVRRTQIDCQSINQSIELMIVKYSNQSTVVFQRLYWPHISSGNLANHKINFPVFHSVCIFRLMNQKSKRSEFVVQGINQSINQVTKWWFNISINLNVLTLLWPIHLIFF